MYNKIICNQVSSYSFSKDVLYINVLHQDNLYKLMVKIQSVDSLIFQQIQFKFKLVLKDNPVINTIPHTGFVVGIPISKRMFHKPVLSIQNVLLNTVINYPSNVMLNLQACNALILLNVDKVYFA